MPLKVYYLDDEVDLGQNFYDAINSDTIVAEVFSKPEEIIARSWQAKPDIILLDYRLPNSNGDEIARKLPDDIPKVLITGDLEARPTYKFIAVLEKPVRANYLVRFLNEFSTSK